ncbi:MAG: transposase [Geminicoccaceae bacterium]|nr:transposase [Geminicoccaceae bacterium]
MMALATEPTMGLSDRFRMGRPHRRRGQAQDADYLDNAHMENFFGSLKTEFVRRCGFATRDDARRTVFCWIEIYYNRRRRHSSIGYLIPAQAFAQMAKAA